MICHTFTEKVTFAEHNATRRNLLMAQGELSLGRPSLSITHPPPILFLSLCVCAAAAAAATRLGSGVTSQATGKVL